MKNTLVSIVLAFLSFAAQAQVGSRHLQGQVQLWSQPLCAGQMNCPLPKPLAVGWIVDLTFNVPTAMGTTQVVDSLYTAAEYQFHLEQFWVVREGKAPYIVTQTQLKSAAGDVIAVCTRYDDAEAFAGLAPGSCGGRFQGGLVGAAFYGPTK